MNRKQLLMSFGLTVLFVASSLMGKYSSGMAYKTANTQEVNLKSFIEDKQSYNTTRFNNIDTRLDQLDQLIQILINIKADKVINAKLDRLLEAKIKSLNKN